MIISLFFAFLNQFFFRRREISCKYPLYMYISLVLKMGQIWFMLLSPLYLCFRVYFQNREIDWVQKFVFERKENFDFRESAGKKLNNNLTILSKSVEVHVLLQKRSFIYFNIGLLQNFEFYSKEKKRSKWL